LASFGVCWFHLTRGNPSFLPDGYLKSSGLYGWLGVEVFFVISGFVIPFALWRSNYLIGDFGRFICKRVVRLDPPYFATILLVIGLGYASTRAPGFQGEPFQFSLPQTLLHVGYLNGLFDVPWLNPVFWTLALEFQYYLLMALIFPLITTPARLVRMVTLICLGILAFVFPADRLVFHWLFLFLYGISTFQFKAGYTGRTEYFVCITAIFAGAWVSYGALIGCLALLTALSIAFIRVVRFGPLAFLGSISYFLYLLHVPIGGRIINLGSRFAHGPSARLLVVFIAASITILTSWLFFLLVERPAQRWSAAITYRRKTGASGFASADPSLIASGKQSR